MATVQRPYYERDDVTWAAETYRVDRYGGVAWRVRGWETAPDEETEWSGFEQRTGKVVAVMVGDDRRFVFDPDQLTPLGELEYCAACGQIGCIGDGRDRSDG